MPRTWEGGCQCGALRYRINGEPLTLYACHCTECQSQSASAFGLSLWVRRSDLEILSGDLKVWDRPADSGKRTYCSFCPNCGSRIHHAGTLESEVVSMKAGSLDDTSGLRPVGHIWVRSKQPWVAIDRGPDALVFEKEPPSFEPFIERWRAQSRSG